MIFCVEDDSSIRDLMIYTLNASGFEAEGFASGEGLFEALKAKRPELIMLDVMLPGEDGITILKKLRAKSSTADIPVIMATAKTTEYDKVLGLDSGADDYLSKPFGMMEMISRVKAVLRRAKPVQKEKILSVGELSVNPAEHTVFAFGEEVLLTIKEFEILQLFMENPGRVYTRDQLLTKIWESDYTGETRTVDVHMGTLRTKLGACGEYIKTVRGLGYKMENKDD